MLDDGHCLREQALAVCAMTGIQELAFPATSLSTLVQMVAGGAGVTLLPRLALPFEQRRAELSIRSFAAPHPRAHVAPPIVPGRRAATDRRGDPGRLSRGDPARPHFMKDLRTPTCFCRSLTSLAS